MKTVFSTLLATFCLLLGTAQQSARAGEVVLDSMACAKQHFVYAKQELQAMLDGKKRLSYERAIFLIENAYYAGGIDSLAFEKALDYHIGNIQTIIQSNRSPKGYAGDLRWLERVEDNKVAYEKALTNWAIFSYLTESRVYSKDNRTFVYYPYEYSTEDPMGTLNWRTTQVSNLLDTKRGNCFALASLFKILSDRFSSDANLCTVPGHIYISHKNEQGTRFNVELTSGSFPGTGTLMTLSYTTKEAIQNNISLRDLNLKQSVALCLVYLGKGYEARFGVKGDDFSLQCAGLALRYDSLNLNAMLQKAAVIEERFIQQGQSMAELREQKDFKTYEALIAKLYRLGYREMPLEMKNIILAGYKRDTLPYVTRNHTPRTFSQNGVQGTRYASLSWGLFDEMHETKSIERYGNTLFDTKTGRITGFAAGEVLYNQYNFDPVAFAWNVDPLAHVAPYSSPYAFCEGNPILHLDPDGRLKVNYNDRILSENGLTRAQVVRFETIIRNVANVLDGNSQAMEVLSNTTGLSPNAIRENLRFGNGPGVTISEVPYYRGADNPSVEAGIRVDPAVVSQLASIDASDKDALAAQSLGVALLLLHEFGHWGDKKTNNGNNTGQFVEQKTTTGTRTDITPKFFLEGNNLRNGTQPYSVSPMGHRGDDVTGIGFGVKVEGGTPPGIIGTVPASYPSVVNPAGYPSIPSALLANVSGQESLNTLGVR